MLADFGGIDLDILNVHPMRKTGLGTDVMEALARYCRPLGVPIYLHSVEPAFGFYRRFEWLRQMSDAVGNPTPGFCSFWPTASDRHR